MSPHLPQDPGRRRPRHGRPPLRAGRDRARPHRDPRHRGRRRGAAAGVRPGRAHLVLRGRRRRALAAARGASTTTRGCGCCLGTAVDGFDPETRDRARWPTARSSPTTSWCWPPARRRSCRRCPGHDLAGCFVYRTIEDLEAIREAAAHGARVGAVIGGGLLGLEAANALVQLGLETHVVEMAPRLMPVQVDDAGGATLVRHIEKLGLTVHTGAATERIARRRTGSPGWRCGTPSRSTPDLVVFSAGIRPRDALARDAGLDARRARRRPGRRAVPHLRPARLGDRRVRGPRRPDVRPGRARLRDGRGRRRRAARRPGHVHRRRHVHQAQAARRRRRVLRRRVRDHRGRARAGLRRRGAGVYKKLVVSEDGTPAARRHPGRRRVGVRRAAADGGPRHRAARTTPRS